MKLESLHIQNFRSCKNLTIEFNDYNCLVGANGAGKSTILAALNILFKNTLNTPTSTLNLSEEDFFDKQISEDIKITATFTNLSQDAKKKLNAYIRQDKLIVSAKATWNSESNCAEVIQFGTRMVMKDFTKYFDAYKSKAKAPELKQIYIDLKAKHPELPDVAKKDDMLSELRKYEESHPDLCEPEESADKFYGFQGTGILNEHIQWVYIPAVKDASSEQDEARHSALGDLLQRTIRPRVNFDEHLKKLLDETKTKYNDIIDAQQSVLNDISSSLQNKIGRAHV